MNDKIDARHLQRLAAVYVRQSSPTQVRNNPESRQRQRALKERAHELGWPEDRILVFEEEQARTASSTHSRQAYRELAEKVVDGRVGIILAVEVSRWARDNVAWQLLLRDCIFADVLLADEKKVYDANDPHDHVVLGIQGVLAEYELGLLRRRMQECWWNKAKRAEMFTNIATGYVEVRGQGLAKHPDQRVQHSLDRMFQKFEQVPSVMKLCQWYLDHEEPLPYVAHGDDPYHVQWLPANYSRLLWMLKNPAYTGAYVLGRTQTIVRRSEDGELLRGRHLVPSEQWEVVEKNRFAAYISWEQYQRNLAKIQGNATMKGDASQAAPRRGVALLAGLLRCGRCGRRLVVHYARTGEPRYLCRDGWRGREQRIQRLSLSGRRVDPLFAQVLLEVLRPAAMEASRRAAELGEREYRQEQQRLSEELKQRAYEAERARRQYDRVEPENRLVAVELEQRWNGALSQVAAVRARLEDFQKQKDAPLNEAETARLMSLGRRLDSIWDAEQTDAMLKKQIVRLLVEEVIVQPGESPDSVELWIHWKGGHHTPLTVPRIGRPGRGHAQEAKLVIGVLRAVCDDAGLAHALNRNGVRCGSETWTVESVRAYRKRHAIAPFDAVQKQSQGLLTGEEAATALGISTMSVHRLVQRGIVPAEQPAPGFPMVIRQNDLLRAEVQEAVRCIQLSLPRPLPADPNQLKLF
ncbi:MAG: recombinase family protein [Thermoguttaceae bacterium]